MENEQDDIELRDEQSADQSEDQGYPVDTPLAEMTDKEQVAYWKTQSRKHEREARKRADYDQVKAERDELKQKSMTDGEKAVEEAREQGKREAFTESGSRIVAAYATALLGDKAETVLAGLNASAFIDEQGDLKDEELAEYLSGWTKPVMGQPKRDPHQGRRPSGRASGMQAGRELANPKLKQS